MHTCFSSVYRGFFCHHDLNSQSASSSPLFWKGSGVLLWPPRLPRVASSGFPKTAGPHRMLRWAEFPTRQLSRHLMPRGGARGGAEAETAVLSALCGWKVPPKVLQKQERRAWYTGPPGSEMQGAGSRCRAQAPRHSKALCGLAPPLLIPGRSPASLGCPF